MSLAILVVELIAKMKKKKAREEDLLEVMVVVGYDHGGKPKNT